MMFFLKYQSTTRSGSPRGWGSVMDKLDLAVEMSVTAHRGQKRKGTAIPYITHPVAVGLSLARLGCRRDLIIAGLLHDAVEDTPLTRGEIEDCFGARVAAIVRGCSENKTKPWRKRKAEMVSYLAAAPLDILTVSLADKVHNLKTMVRDRAAGDEGFWDRFNRGRGDQKWYYGELDKVFASRLESAAVNHLYGEFSAAFRQLFAFA